MTLTNQIGGVLPAELQGRKLSLKTIFMFNLVWIIIFAVIYFIIGQSENQFNHTRKTLTFLDALYFAVTTQTSVGYGDISPRSTIAKLFVMIQQLSVLIELVAIISGNMTDETFLNMGRKITQGAKNLKSGIWNPKMALPSMPSITSKPSVPSTTVPEVAVASVSEGTPNVETSSMTPFKQKLSTEVTAASTTN
tara:strand:+ start:55 stop:636 length:582 start_codon:yes stop_codon:yes gene_type:complete